MREFYQLIDQLNAALPAEQAPIEQRIRAEFEVEQAVFALDMSGFSLTVRRDGILAYLGMIRRMQLLSAPLIEKFGGVLVKQEADNLLALFATAGDAVLAALAINQQLQNPQARYPAAAAAAGALQGKPIRVSIGIDYGRLLSIPGWDCFGDPVNTAHKLGEDLAEAGEVLITRAACDRLSAEVRARLQIDDLQLSVSGLHIAAARVRFADMSR